MPNWEILYSTHITHRWAHTNTHMQCRGDERRGSHTCHSAQWAVLGVSALLKGTSAMPSRWTSTLQLPVHIILFLVRVRLEPATRAKSLQTELLLPIVPTISGVTRSTFYNKWCKDNNTYAVVIILFKPHSKFKFDRLKIILRSTTGQTHPHAENQEADFLHQWVFSDLLFPFLLRGERVIAPLAQFHIHDARLDEASSHILQLQVQVWGSGRDTGLWHAVQSMVLKTSLWYDGDCSLTSWQFVKTSVKRTVHSVM